MRRCTTSGSTRPMVLEFAFIIMEEGESENFTIRDNSIHMMNKGFHSVVSAPGYTTYYLWFLAGNQRVQGVAK